MCMGLKIAKSLFTNISFSYLISIGQHLVLFGGKMGREETDIFWH